MIWAIVGLGWLGEALSHKLPASDSFWGTHREDLNLLNDTLPQKNHDILFLNTPPLKDLLPVEFVEKIKHTNAKKIIFISSTSVFGDHQEEVNEKSTPDPTTPNGIWLSEVEMRLRDQFTNRLQIIRPAGLIGDKRHPVHYFQGRHNIPGGLDRVNLIHRLDLINLILEMPMTLEILHAVAPFHPTKMEYYPQWCERLKLKDLSFEKNSTTSRVIHSLYARDLIKWQCPQLDFL